MRTWKRLTCRRCGLALGVLACGYVLATLASQDATSDANADGASPAPQSVVPVTGAAAASAEGTAQAPVPEQDEAAANISAVRPVDHYAAKAQRQARNYDRAQDISPRQLLTLLEVCERTGKSLGQALATGEFESAKTWNNYVRPTLGSGGLGSATGVWQFIPSTFHLIIKKYGEDLLAVSSADPSSGRTALDLGSGPFSDAEVRQIIRETTEGLRDPDDEALQLLRHNFAVLAFAKHYLSVDSGAKTPVEDYLFHFLGERRGREILALANGPARHTLTVRPVAPPAGESASRPGSGLVALDLRQQQQRLGLDLRPSDAVPGGRAVTGSRDIVIARLRPRADSAVYRLPRGLPAGAERRPGLRQADVAPSRPVANASAYPADSPVVTGNLGMFYRNASARTDPYTWAEFMDALAKRVKADQQPAMVRAKYGVGFQMPGGDMPGWAFRADRPGELLQLEHESFGPVVVPEDLLTAPLDGRERERYKARLAELIRLGEDRPLADWPPEVVAGFRHLGLLSSEVRRVEPGSAAARDALQAFRALVGKAAPDDPALADRLMPAERAALEIYDARIADFALLQRSQRRALTQALDLNAIRGLLKRHRLASKRHIARVQQALAEEGLSTQTRAARRTRLEDFDGIAGPLTIGSLDQFQLSQGLRPTGGLLDAVTLSLLGLPPLGQDIFLPPTGPASPVLKPLLSASLAAGPSCEAPPQHRPTDLVGLIRSARDPLSDWTARLAFALSAHRQLERSGPQAAEVGADRG